MDKKKIHEVIEKFFGSLKSKENEMLETGLTQNQTVDALHLAVLNAIEGNEKKFEVFVKWFLSSSMYLLDENEELEDIESFIKRAVAELNYNETDILAFRMVYLLDYKVSEVAGTLHLNRTTLDYRLKKMVQKLREIYGNYGSPKRR